MIAGGEGVLARNRQTLAGQSGVIRVWIAGRFFRAAPRVGVWYRRLYLEGGDRLFIPMGSWSADNHPTFPGPRFATSFFIEYGRSAGVDSSDQYIYAVSNDGFWDCGNDMILGRVLKLKMASLNGADWEYFRGGDGMKSSAWAPHFNDAKPRRPIGTSHLRLRGER